MTAVEIKIDNRIKRIPETQIRFNNGLIISENNRSVWSFSINNALRNAEGEVGDHRFMEISVDVNGVEVLLAQGIWNLEQANEVKNGIEDNTPRIKDYFDCETEKGDNLMHFRSDATVLEFLINNKVFVRGEDYLGNRTYKVVPSFVFANNEKFPNNMDVYPYKINNTDKVSLMIRIHK